MEKDAIQIQQWLTDIPATRAQDGLGTPSRWSGSACVSSSMEEAAQGLTRLVAFFKVKSEEPKTGTPPQTALHMIPGSKKLASGQAA